MPGVRGKVTSCSSVLRLTEGAVVTSVQLLEVKSGLDWSANGMEGMNHESRMLVAEREARRVSAGRVWDIQMPREPVAMSLPPSAEDATDSQEAAMGALEVQE